MPLDSATQALLAQAAGGGAKPLSESTPAEARALSAGFASMNGPAPKMARVEDHHVAVTGGTIAVRALVPIEPARGALVYYHGGGWVIGNIDEYDTLGRKLAERTSCAVIMVDYRLAPEHRYPVAADDSYAALEWTAANIAHIAGQPNVPLMVAGDSAGGDLAAVVCQRARDRKGPTVSLQVLVYPVTDCDLDTASYRDPANQLLLTKESMSWFWDHYAPDAARRAEPDASPLRAKSFAGLPPASILTAEYDVLRDEGEAYAEQLKAAGVPVEFKRHLGQTHGFFQFLILPGSERGFQQVVKAVRACCANYRRGLPAIR